MLNNEMPTNAVDWVVLGKQELIADLRARQADLSLSQQERESLQGRIDHQMQLISQLRAKPAEPAAAASPQPMAREYLPGWTDDPRKPIHGIQIIG